MPIIYHILIFATTKALALDCKGSTAWPGVGTVGPCHGALSIWQHGIAQPSPSWSEANSPTPQCRILGIAAHGDAVMCHLALGPAGQELSLTSPLKLVCHWGPRQGESPRTTCMHSPHDADRLEGDCRHLLGKVFFFLSPAGLSAQSAGDAAGPNNRSRSKIVQLVPSQQITLSLSLAS